MVEIRKTNQFASWIDKLRDVQAKARVLVRIQRLVDGNPGDVKPIGKGLSEMRINYGPGYRMYFMKHGKEIIILLIGGTKGSQQKDIQTAQKLAANL